VSSPGRDEKGITADSAENVAPAAYAAGVRPEDSGSEDTGSVGSVKISELWGGADSSAGDTSGTYAQTYDRFSEEPTAAVAEPVSVGDVYASPVQQELHIDLLHVMGSVFGAYIAAVDDDSFYLIDWHAAHERVNFERLMTEYHSATKVSQEMLTPEILHVPASARSGATAWADWLATAGYAAEVFGDDSIIIRAVPAFLGMDEALRYAGDIIESGGKTPPDNDKAIERLISKACRSSVKANSNIKTDEANALLRSLAACANPYTCPHGRPVFIRYTKRDLEKLFKRT
jgi:DNA mismatch repair protein MutL